LVESAGSGVAGNDCEPCSLVTVHLDETLRFGEQDGCHPRSAVVYRYVDLFDLVIDHHHEPRDCVIDDRDHRVVDTLWSSQFEGLLSPGRVQIVRNVPQVAVAPPVVPDLRDRLRVIKARGTKHNGLIVVG
jgi:hypothetical protein